MKSLWLNGFMKMDDTTFDEHAILRERRIENELLQTRGNTVQREEDSTAAQHIKRHNTEAKEQDEVTCLIMEVACVFYTTPAEEGQYGRMAAYHPTYWIVQYRKQYGKIFQKTNEEKSTSPRQRSEWDRGYAETDVLIRKRHLISRTYAKTVKRVRANLRVPDQRLAMVDHDISIVQRNRRVFCSDEYPDE